MGVTTIPLPVTQADIDGEAHEVTIVQTRHHHRMLSSGIPFHDWDELRQQAPTTWQAWYGYWTSLGADYDHRATEAGDHPTTAASHWVTGALCYQFAQFMLYRHADAKRLAERERARLYALALPLLQPRAEALAVPFEDLTVPAVLRIPPGATTPLPCVLIVPGLEATKEEMHDWERYYLDRGIAAVAMDGPGQGELSGVPLDPATYARAASAVADVLRADPRIDAGRIGIMGVSLGGMLASMAAAIDGRFTAAAEVCGSFDTESRWARANALTRAGHRHVTKSADDAEVGERIRTWTMRDLAGEIRCPFLVVHGENDPIVPLDQATMYEAAVPGAELVVFAGANHVCNNIANVSRPFIADWFADHLTDAARK
jgi:2,6-dihydroxypseudooxynicotine hydrolase